MTILTPSGATRTITAGRPWHDAEWYWTGNETAETLAAHGYIVQPDPEPEPPPTAAETLAAKSAGLKLAENAFLAALAAAAQDLGVDMASLPARNITALTAAADASGQPEAKIAKWESRLTSRWLDVVYHSGLTAGVYDGLPTVPHADV